MLVVSLVLLASSSLAIAARADAAVGGTRHPIAAGWLNRNKAQGIWAICFGKNYACAGGGYNGSKAQTQTDNWYKQFWSWGSKDFSDPAKLHNCTTYAGFRQWSNGVNMPRGFHGDASAWARNAATLRVNVDQTPKVGSVAQWNLGHVAYVEDVGTDYIEITADNFTTRSTEHFLIRNGSRYWPDNFIHFKDMPKFGDLNGDYVVDVRDLSILQSRWGTSDRVADLNRSGTVDIVDLSLLLSRWSSIRTFAALAN